ncbi:Nuclear transcription factor Y subunit A [Dillenia turbinata]|uniref:Nuclear transcription factor Y subunit n=1 Tax=Dillenia turbinata TaxID=194707 RepID=A0AAN8VFQ3_9MAGN
MQTLCFNEQRGIVHNSVQPRSAIPCMPWWVGIGSQQVYADSHAQSKSPELNQHKGALLTSLGGISQEPIKEKPVSVEFSIIPGSTSGSMREKDAQTHLTSSLPGHEACFELGLAQPLVLANYPQLEQYFGVFSAYGTQPPGRIRLPLDFDEGPIYVNAKQYNGIIRRRKIREKFGIKKVVRERKFMHISRHLHAMRRPRGSGGRFLNTKATSGGKDGNSIKETEQQHLSCPRSPSSEVLQSESGNLNTSKEACGSRSMNLSGAEVTSMFYDCFQINHVQTPSFHTLANAESVQINKWVTAANGRCDLLKV